MIDTNEVKYFNIFQLQDVYLSQIDYKFSFENFDNIAERSWVLSRFWWFNLTFAELPGSARSFSKSTVFVSCCDKYFPYERSYMQINDGMIFLVYFDTFT